MTADAVTFTVLGIAQPKGSAKAFMRPGMKFPIVTSDNKSVKSWEHSVRSAAQQQCGGVYFEAGVRIAMVFFLPRPASLPKRVTQHLKKPDVDKLARAALDSLKGVLWRDDSQVIDLIARKAYAATQPHVRIVVDHAAPIEEAVIEPDLFAVLEEVRA